MGYRPGLSSLLGALAATAVLIVLGLAVGSALGSGSLFHALALDLLVLGLVGAGALLATRGRPIAGAGAVVAAVATWLAFDYTVAAIVWTVLFFVGVGLAIYGTRT